MMTKEKKFREMYLERASSHIQKAKDNGKNDIVLNTLVEIKESFGIGFAKRIMKNMDINIDLDKIDLEEEED
jgi:hypothetical protein